MCLQARLLELLPPNTLARALKWFAQHKNRSSSEVKQLQTKLIKAWNNTNSNRRSLLQFLLQVPQAPQRTLVELLRHGSSFRTILGEELIESFPSDKDLDSLVYLVPLLMAHGSELGSKQLFCSNRSWWTEKFRPYTLLALLVTSVYALFYIPEEGRKVHFSPQRVFEKAMCLIAAFVHSAVRTPALSYFPPGVLFRDPEVAAVVQIELRCSLVALEEEVLPFLQQWMLGAPASSSNPDHQRAWFWFWQLQKEQFCGLIHWGVQNAAELFSLTSEEKLKKTALWLQSFYEESSPHSQPASVANLLGNLKLGVDIILQRRRALGLNSRTVRALQTFLHPPLSQSKYMMFGPGGKVLVDRRYGENLVEFGPPLAARGETFQFQWNLSSRRLCVATGPVAFVKVSGEHHTDAILLQVDLSPELAATDDPWRALLDDTKTVFINTVKNGCNRYPAEVHIWQGRTHLKFKQDPQYGRYQLSLQTLLLGQDVKAQNSASHALEVGHPILSYEGCGDWSLSHNGTAWSLYYKEQTVVSFKPEFPVVGFKRSDDGAVLLFKKKASLRVLDNCREILCSVDLPLETTSLKRLLRQKQFQSQEWLSVAEIVPQEGSTPASKANRPTASRKPLPRASKAASQTHRGAAREDSYPY